MGSFDHLDRDLYESSSTPEAPERASWPLVGGARAGSARVFIAV